MVNQFNKEIPVNLIVPNPPCLLDDEMIVHIDNMDWYEYEDYPGLILVEDDGIVPGDSPKDCGISLDEDGNIIPDGKIQKIDTCLHRWNEFDGWYHD